MNKLFALYKNELRRVFGRPTLWIGLGLAFVLTLAGALKARETVLGQQIDSSLSGAMYFQELEDRKNNNINNAALSAQTLTETEAKLPGLQAVYESAKASYEADGTKDNKATLAQAETAYRSALNDACRALCTISVSKVESLSLEMQLEYKLAHEDYRPMPLNAVLEQFKNTYNIGMVEGSLSGALERYNKLTAELPSAEQDAIDKLNSYRPAIEAADFGFFVNELKQRTGQEADSFRKTAQLEAFDFIICAGTASAGLVGGREALRKADEYVSARTEQLMRLEHDGVTNPGMEELSLQVSMLAADLKNNISVERALRISRFSDRLWASMVVADPNTVINLSLSLAGLLAVLLTVILLAAGSVAGSVKDGSIKSLIVAPVTRQKIIWSKILMLLTVTLCMTLATTFFALFAGSAVTGIWEHGRILYNVGNSPRILPFWVATLLSSLIDAGVIFFFAMLALLLSTLTRNSLVSAMLPAGLYVAYLITSFTGGITSDRLIRAVLPMENMSNLWFSREVSSMLNVVNATASYESYRIQYIFHPFSRIYSLIYLAVLFAALIWAIVDAFCRRDIA